MVYRFIQENGGDFDIIIDDGSHKMNHQQISFDVLFPHLKSGGIYVIEDLHTSVKPLLGAYNPQNDDPTLDILKRWEHMGKLHSKKFTNAFEINKSIEDVKVEECRMSPIAFIFKK